MQCHREKLIIQTNSPSYLRFQQYQGGLIKELLTYISDENNRYLLLLSDRYVNYSCIYPPLDSKNKNIKDEDIQRTPQIVICYSSSEPRLFI